MGKKSRKLRSPKYVNKAKAFRERAARLNGKNTNNEVTLQIEESTINNTIETEPTTNNTIETIEKTVPNALKETTTKKSGRKKVVRKATTKPTTTKKKTITTKRRTKKTANA